MTRQKQGTFQPMYKKIVISAYSSFSLHTFRVFVKQSPFVQYVYMEINRKKWIINYILNAIKTRNFAPESPRQNISGHRFPQAVLLEGRRRHGDKVSQVLVGNKLWYDKQIILLHKPIHHLSFSDWPVAFLYKPIQVAQPASTDNMMSQQTLFAIVWDWVSVGGHKITLSQTHTSPT